MDIDRKVGDNTSVPVEPELPMLETVELVEETEEHVTIAPRTLRAHVATPITLGILPVASESDADAGSEAKISQHDSTSKINSTEAVDATFAVTDTTQSAESLSRTAAVLITSKAPEISTAEDLTVDSGLQPKVVSVPVPVPLARSLSARRVNFASPIVTVATLEGAETSTTDESTPIESVIYLPGPVPFRSALSLRDSDRTGFSLRSVELSSSRSHSSSTSFVGLSSSSMAGEYIYTVDLERTSLSELGYNRFYLFIRERKSGA